MGPVPSAGTAAASATAASRSSEVLQRLLLYDPVWLRHGPATRLVDVTGRHRTTRVGGRQRQPSQSPCKRGPGSSPATVAPLTRRAALLLLLLAVTSLALGSADGGAARPRTFSLVAGGDIAMAGTPGGSSFTGIERFLHGDIVFGNLEGTLTTSGTPKCAPYGVDGCFTFRTAPSFADGLRAAGFTLVNMANNHAMDYGPEAQLATIRAVRAAHLDLTGLPGQIEVVDA